MGAEIIKHQTHIPSDEMSLEAKIIPVHTNENIYDIISKSSLSLEKEIKLQEFTKKINIYKHSFFKRCR